MVDPGVGGVGEAESSSLVPYSSSLALTLTVPFLCVFSRALWESLGIPLFLASVGSSLKKWG